MLQRELISIPVKSANYTSIAVASCIYEFFNSLYSLAGLTGRLRKP
jgi:hypothetical protein